MGKVVLVSHSRIKEMAEPREKYSEVWTEICKGAEEEAREKRTNLEILAPRSYHDHKEFISLIKEATQKNPDALIIPFTPTENELVKEMTSILKEFKGKIVTVNVPPMSEIKEQLGNIVGYVGMNERAAGRLAVFWLVTRNTDIRKILVVKHEEGHYGHRLRIHGVKEIDVSWLVSRPTKVEEIYTGVETYKIDALKKSLSDEQAGVVTLGVRGTEAVLQTGIPTPIVGMDLNDNIRFAIKEGKVLATLIQHPAQEGSLAVKMASEIITNPALPYREVFCGPTLVTQNNVSCF